MKRIMKKALSLMLALVMMLSLAPVTAEAADVLADGAVYQFSAEENTITVAKDATISVEVYYGKSGGTFGLKITGSATGFSAIDVPINEMYTDTYTDTNAVVESDIYVKPAMAGGSTFSLENNTGADATFTIELIEPLGTQNNPDVIELNAEYGSATVEKEITMSAATQGYIIKMVAPGNGKMGIKSISSSNGWTYAVNNETTGQYGETQWNDSDPIKTEWLEDVSAGDVLQIMVNTYDPSAWEAPEGTLNVTFYFLSVDGELPRGKAANYAIETESGKEYTNNYEPLTYYTYTAEVAGLYTVETAGEVFFTSLKGETVSADAYVKDEGVAQIELAKDDVLVFSVKGTKDTTKVNVNFEAGAKLEKPDEVLEYGKGGDLTVGDKTYAVDGIYAYTVFEFKPTETGKYTITATDAKIGYVGDYYVNTALLNGSVVKETTLEMNCTDVGQGKYIAVEAMGATANIKITKTGEAEKNEIPVFDASMSATPGAYTYEGDTSALKRVKVTDDVIDKAVVDANGIFHLNSVDGPVLYVNLNDSARSLADVYNYGQLKAVYYNDDKTPNCVVSYMNLFEAYYQYSNDEKDNRGAYKLANPYYYPLTVDLMNLLQRVGASLGWYTEGDSNCISAKEDAWMFACYYDESVTTEKLPLESIPTMSVNVTEKPYAEADIQDLVNFNKNGQAICFNVVEDGELIVAITFAPGTMELVDGVEAYDFSAEIVKEYTGIKDEAAKNAFVLRINYAYSGKLPAEATIQIAVGKDYANKTLYYYQLMEDGTLKFVCDAPVDAEGYATVKQDHCSDYVLLNEKLPETAPKTGDNSNIALWVAVLGLGVVAIAGSVVMRKREF